MLMAAKLNLDKLDLQIIHEMMETAEVSYADLGKKLFVSGGTIHVRIKKLQEFGMKELIEVDAEWILEQTTIPRTLKYNRLILLNCPKTIPAVFAAPHAARTVSAAA